MSKDIKLVFLEMKTHIFMYILPLVIIYCIFMPYCISEIQYIDNPMQKELTYFMIAQRYLNIFIVFYLWLLFRNYIDSDLVETLISIDSRYRIRFIFYAMIIYIIALFPYFIISYILLDGCIYLILGLIFEFIILSCIFYRLTMLFKNCLITLISIIIFILLFTHFFIMEEPYILFDPTILTSQLSMTYWICQICIGIVMIIIGFIIEKKKLYMS